MSNPPAFQFYPAEFISDENVVLMNNTEVGCYIKLMCYCWREGSIPGEIESIAKLCGENSSAMAQLWQKIKPCFKASSNGRLRHSRLDKEREKQLAFSKERSKSGKRGAEKRWKKSKLNSSAIKQLMAKNSSLSSSSSSKDNSNLTVTCPQQEILALYHITLPELPRVKEWTPARQKMLRQRWKEKTERQSLEWWKKYFRYIKKCPLLMGDNDRGWQANLEWIIRPKNLVKIIEGNYEQRN